VQRVLVRVGRATGVVLDTGEEIRAPIVVSSLDARRTFLDLVDGAELPEELLRQVRRFRFRGSSGKVNLALSELPDFTCMPGVGVHHRGAFSISPSVDYLERAYDDAKHGGFSRRPYMDIVFPSMIDPGMAPPGRHVASIFVQYAPYHVDGGWDDAKREAFGDAVVDTLSEYAPNLKSAILHRQVLTPADIEATTGLSEGNIFQGELALQQLFFLRPAVRWAGYRTPIAGYYQCGSSTPGGIAPGSPPRNASWQTHEPRFRQRRDRREAVGWSRRRVARASARAAVEAAREAGGTLRERVRARVSRRALALLTSATCMQTCCATGAVLRPSQLSPVRSRSARAGRSPSAARPLRPRRDCAATRRRTRLPGPHSPRRCTRSRASWASCSAGRHSRWKRRGGTSCCRSRASACGIARSAAAA
jgi:hypothetical protein